MHVFKAEQSPLSYLARGTLYKIGLMSYVAQCAVSIGQSVLVSTLQLVHPPPNVIVATTDRQSLCGCTPVARSVYTCALSPLQCERIPLSTIVPGGSSSIPSSSSSSGECVSHRTLTAWQTTSSPRASRLALRFSAPVISASDHLTALHYCLT